MPLLKKMFCFLINKMKLAKKQDHIVRKNQYHEQHCFYG